MYVWRMSARVNAYVGLGRMGYGCMYVCMSARRVMRCRRVHACTMACMGLGVHAQRRYAQYEYATAQCKHVCVGGLMMSAHALRVMRVSWVTGGCRSCGSARAMHGDAHARDACMGCMRHAALGGPCASCSVGLCMLLCWMRGYVWGVGGTAAAMCRMHAWGRGNAQCACMLCTGYAYAGHARQRCMLRNVWLVMMVRMS